jgi:hypothetical protein
MVSPFNWLTVVIVFVFEYPPLNHNQSLKGKNLNTRTIGMVLSESGLMSVVLHCRSKMLITGQGRGQRCGNTIRTRQVPNMDTPVWKVYRQIELDGHPHLLIAHH